jgi:Sec-independent protein translocase protein TatA
MIPHLTLISSFMSSHFPIAFLNALGGSPLEMAIVVIAVLVLFGAKSLPGTLRTLGRWSEQLKRISRELQQEIADAGEPLQEVRKEWDDTAASLRVTQTDSTFAARPEPVEDAEEGKKEDPPP